MTIASVAISLHLLDGTPHGPRVVECRSSPLRVHAARWLDMQLLFDAGLPAAPSVYLFTGPARNGNAVIAVRPGEASDIRRRLLEHAQDTTKARFHEIFAVTAVDGRLAKPDVRYLEARFHEIAASLASSHLDVDKIPAVMSYSAVERTSLEILLQHCRQLLRAAGCLALDCEGLPALITPPDSDEETVRLDFDQSGGQDEHELVYDAIWARGYPHRDGFVVRAGSDVRRRENAGLLAPMAERRRFLLNAGVLGEMPGVSDRWRLMRDILLNSELIAAKVVTGAHQSNRGIWRRISPSARMIVAK
jgi:hypothetical protein